MRQAKRLAAEAADEKENVVPPQDNGGLKRKRETQEGTPEAVAPVRKKKEATLVVEIGLAPAGAAAGAPPPAPSHELSPKALLDAMAFRLKCWELEEQQGEIPAFLSKWLWYVRSLGPGDTPDYAKLRALLAAAPLPPCRPAPASPLCGAKKAEATAAAAAGMRNEE